MSALTTDQFSDFFHAVHGVEPFPWQERLMQRVLDAGKGWPQAITLPTASGKTACIDIALFALAAQADLPPGQRTAPRRIAFVVDRRIIVDEASARAEKITAALKPGARDSAIVEAVACRLRALAGDFAEDPLRVVTLRGGVFRDQTWSNNPLQPLVLCSTVDQLGSRLLFRGYGASPGALPIQAGLVGNDMLILLDEAHIAEPFLQTANAIAHYRRYAQDALPAPFRFVVMSATPPEACTDRFPATDEELIPDRQHPTLGKRWSASKPASLVIAEGTKQGDFVEKLAVKLVSEAKTLQKEDRRVIAILVNRVATAQRVAELLKDKPHVLLTGRMRPYDRDRIVAKAESTFHLSTGAAAKNPERGPVFVVATQCLEVGADMDFDGLVTECASLGSLRQRFGRLNRGGRPIQALATIVIRADQNTAPADDKNLDPVYARALPETWTWLNTIPADQLDFGINALQPQLAALEPSEAAKLRLEPRDAPAMLPAHIEAWSQTSPKPHCEPEPSLFLHGKSTNAPEISLCWRLNLAPPSQGNEEALFDHIALCPPAAAECLSVPRWALLQWFATTKDDQAAKALSLDSDDTSKEPDLKLPESDKPLFAVCWRGPLRSNPKHKKQADDNEASSFIITNIRQLDGLKQGDTIILSDHSSALFWLREDIAGKDIPSIHLDLGDYVQHSARARPTLRFHKNLTAHWPKPSTAKDDEPQWPELLQPWLEANSIEPMLEDLAPAKAHFQAILKSLQECAKQSPEHQWLLKACAALHDEIDNQRRLERAIHQPLSPAGFILRSTRRYRLSLDVEDDPTPDDSFSSSRSAQAVLLETHSKDVAKRASQHAKAVGLPETIVRAFHLAGLLHDTGKADPRFQSMLIAGSPGFAPAIDQLLAKSARLPATRRQAEEQRKAAGYPAGGRHELLSTRLAECSPALWQDIEEQDLILHLIASHHGYCRPFAPVINDPHGLNLTVTCKAAQQSLTHVAVSGLERLDSAISERFWRLQNRFGPWGLAWLEALFRLADQQVSAIEQTITQPA
ncbi:type I-G CRISPR-associated helicase/endonuclease Cas3g [Prosthecobacter dejongeii]|uniref:CRISPR-associated endonuclease/helicase Cas3 n=1 Tax=Prosthecobacter dejongeii TaxID=48465 RepID=A0A7W7YLC7_9BACT|nr:type I-U CRISPR-associated helicase/endonuclease Cas3 [Prosthecobacter dejongeii]MBB5038167.1 CRISPR-associated endonuclease/helicase Cas3 [Prosthecobacter dejongeii]